MRKFAACALIVMGAVGGLLYLATLWNDTKAQTPRREGYPGEGGLIALSAVASDHHQQVTVVDPTRMVLAVYHVGLADGKVELKSVRSIRWDLELEEFGGVGLLPRDIRSLVEQR
jgi:hypothetical protein